MGSNTFVGGVHPTYGKEFSKDISITPSKPPAQVIIPVQQHIGAPCEPLVEVGDEVKLGQKIADSEGFVSAPIHSSVSGKVTKIEPFAHPLGKPVLSIFIESDGQETWADEVKPNKPLGELSAEEIKQIVREAGIVGLGGATFPAHVKLSPPPDKPIDTLIINGAECEPYLTADHRIMVERPDDVVYGLKAMLKSLGATRGIIGIEDNKLDAIEAMEKAIQGEAGLEVMALHTKYPQGAEKMLIKATTGREVPPGALPMEVNVVNHNSGTAVAVTEAIKLGKPLIDRVVTITGPGIERPANLIVKVGTMISDIVEQCGGLRYNARKVIIGGPMMGLAQPTLEIPAIKGTSGVLVLTDEEVQLHDISSCVKCAKCIDVCPMNLLPNFIGSASEQGFMDRAEALGALDCFECGCCTYICPAKRPLTQWIRIAKAEITARRKK